MTPVTCHGCLTLFERNPNDAHPFETRFAIYLCSACRKMADLHYSRWERILNRVTWRIDAA